MEQLVIDTPLGLIEIEFSSSGLTRLQRCHSSDYSTRIVSERAQTLKSELDRYFRGELHCFSTALDPHGTSFQKAVWSELQKIPYGQRRTYAEVAVALGDRNKARAVGLSNSRNPIWILIPCHRVVAKGDGLGGYAGGLDMKLSLLELESNNVHTQIKS